MWLIGNTFGYVAGGLAALNHRVGILRRFGDHGGDENVLAIGNMDEFQGP